MRPAVRGNAPPSCVMLVASNQEKTARLMQKFLAVLGATLALCSPALAQTPAVIAPNSNLRVEGIPPIPTLVAAGTATYTELKPTFALGWHPTRRSGTCLPLLESGDPSSTAARALTPTPVSRAW